MFKVHILLQIDHDLIDNVGTIGDNGYTGYGIALLLSLTFNYFIYREFKFIQSKLITHLENMDKNMEELTNLLLNHKNHS